MVMMMRKTKFPNANVYVYKVDKKMNNISKGVHMWKISLELSYNRDTSTLLTVKE